MAGTPEGTPTVTFPGVREERSSKEDDARPNNGSTQNDDQAETITEGNVIDVDYSVTPPIAYIANVDTPLNATRGQLVAVVLACSGGCDPVRAGDYLEVQGEKDHEQQYIASKVSVTHGR